VTAWLAVRLAPPASWASRSVDVEGSDEDLVAQAQGGDHRAFSDLYARHVDLVWRRLTRILGPDPDREDLTQQIFLEVFRDLSGFRGDARFKTFLYRVAANAALDHLGRRRRKPLPITGELLDDMVSPGLTPERRAEEREQLALVWAMLDRIKPKKRIAFVLRVIEGLSLEEVGEIVGASVPTVAQRVKYAHDELSALLERRTGGL
jgi:RNA polymerase sigma-70 factor (ECF subfamily)